MQAIEARGRWNRGGDWPVGLGLKGFAVSFAGALAGLLIARTVAAGTDWWPLAATAGSLVAALWGWRNLGHPGGR